MVSERQEKSPEKIESHPEWQGEPPPLLDPLEIKEIASKIAKGHGKLSRRERNQLVIFLLESDRRFFSVRNSNGSYWYHRPCGGGAVRKIGAGLFCSKCKDVEEVIPPDFLI